MKIAVLIVRLLLGTMFFVFGLNVFLNFIPVPPMGGDVAIFMDLFLRTGWFKFIGLLYLIAGALLVAGRYVPIALVILGPIFVNILIYHLTLDRAGIPVAVVILLLYLFLLRAYWAAFRGLFVAKMDV